MKGLIFFAPFAVALLSGCGSSNLGTLSAGITPGTTVPPGTQSASSSGNFAPAGNLNSARAAHAAVLLPSGKVLIAGGVGTGYPQSQPLASAELYDPATHSFTPTGNMTVSRASPSAVLLANGKVLIVGGAQDLSTEIYDPSTGTFTSAGNLVSAGTGAPGSFDYRLSLLLQDGRVLVEGVNAEIYDPTPGTFSPTAAYADANPYWLTSTLLQDGRVLLTGCVSSCTAGAVELYDPITNAFSFAGLPTQWGDISTATRLVSGKVLFVGNWQNDGLPADAELYDPVASRFASLGTTIAPHEFSAAVRLTDGKVLITGGQLPGGSGDGGTDLYDPSTGTFASGGNMIAGRHSHSATLLPDGTVLLVGGYTTWPAPTSSAEIYKPTTP